METKDQNTILNIVKNLNYWFFSKISTALHDRHSTDETYHEGKHHISILKEDFNKIYEIFNKYEDEENSNEIKSYLNALDLIENYLDTMPIDINKDIKNGFSEIYGQYIINQSIFIVKTLPKLIKNETSKYIDIHDILEKITY